jgi:GR25 family glycosyltransferase involved in LPS biosynthesis
MKYKPEKYILFFILGFFLTLILIHSYSFYRSSQDNFTTFLFQNQYEAIVTEYFESKSEIDYYVITMKNPERIENINQQKNKLKQQGTPIDIQLVDAVVGVDLNLNELIKTEILSPHFKSYRGSEINKKKEIGCYMSHLKIYEMIQQKEQTSTSNPYSVIFEDDFDIDSSLFLKDVNESLEYLKNNKLDFDILYLGTIPHNHGNLLDKKIYEIDKKTGLEGTHGMIIHNKNVSKLITNLKPMKQAFDVELTQLCHRDKLNAYVIYPHIVNQQWEKIPSEIAKENFQSSKLKPSDFNHE